MRLIAFLAALTLAPAVWSAPVQQPHSDVELIAERAALTPGHSATLGLRLRMEPGWHVYWKNPGDSGMATSIAWTLPAGFSAGQIQWPHPQRIELGPLTNYGYEREVVLLTEVQLPAGLAPGSSVPIAAQADWLVCKEICIPASARLTLELPVSATPAAPDARWVQALHTARAAVPVPAPDWLARAERDPAGFILRLIPPPAAPRLEALVFFPEREGVIANAQPQRFAASTQGYELRIQVSPQPVGQARALAGVLVAQPGFNAARAIDIDLPIAGSAAAAAIGTGSFVALLLAFGGGLLLNLMPCVFPVLAIKVLSVVQRTHSHPAQLRAHGVLFSVGVLLSFWAIAGLLLALRAQGEALGWGYQLQSPVFVAGLAVLFFVLGLNLSGVFHMGARVQSLAGGLRARGSHADALLSGVLATAIASPCTAPFMGAALGYALVRPAPEAMLVFTALALGMALPYLVLCCVPRLTRRLPRPGAWMDSLKQVLAFPLYASVVWLVWVLGQQAGIDAVARLLSGLVLVAAGCWAIGHWARAARGARVVARILALLVIAGGLVLAWPAEPPSTARSTAQTAWQPWSAAAVQAAVSRGQPAFVDFTAAWCVTCQVNKRLVLSAEPVERRFAELDVVRLRADWTSRDPAITAALARLNRSGVPVYALYPAGGGEPRLLPEVLTQGLVLDALAQTTPRPAPASAAMIPPSAKEKP